MQDESGKRLAELITFDEDDQRHLEESGIDDDEVVSLEGEVELNGMTEAQKWAVAEIALLVEDVFETAVESIPDNDGSSFDQQVDYLLYEAHSHSNVSYSDTDDDTEVVFETAVEMIRRWIYVAWWSQYGGEYIHRKSSQQ